MSGPVIAVIRLKEVIDRLNAFGILLNLDDTIDDLKSVSPFYFLFANESTTTIYQIMQIDSETNEVSLLDKQWVDKPSRSSTEPRNNRWMLSQGSESVVMSNGTIVTVDGVNNMIRFSDILAPRKAISNYVPLGLQRVDYTRASTQALGSRMVCELLSDRFRDVLVYRNDESGKMNPFVVNENREIKPFPALPVRGSGFHFSEITDGKLDGSILAVWNDIQADMNGIGDYSTGGEDDDDADDDDIDLSDLSFEDMDTFRSRRYITYNHAVNVGIYVWDGTRHLDVNFIRKIRGRHSVIFATGDTFTEFFLPISIYDFEVNVYVYPLQAAAASEEEEEDPSIIKEKYKGVELTPAMTVELQGAETTVGKCWMNYSRTKVYVVFRCIIGRSKLLTFDILFKTFKFTTLPY